MLDDEGFLLGQYRLDGLFILACKGNLVALDA